MFKFDLSSHKKYSVQHSQVIDLTLQYKQYAGETWREPVSEDSPVWRSPCYGWKPRGLWYAFGRGWLDFHPSCASIDDKLLPSLFELEVDTDKFIKLTSEAEIFEFNKRYEVESEEPGCLINWHEVANQYDGLEVIPFNRMFTDLRWYQSLDISSGCIWNLNAIQNIKRLN